MRAPRWIGLCGLVFVTGVLPRPAIADPKGTFEDKCLFCHSRSIIEGERLRPAQWRAVVLKMSARAPLLIGRRDIDVIVRYLVRDLRLVPRRLVRPRPAAPEGGPKPSAEPTTADEAAEEEETAETPATPGPAPAPVPGPMAAPSVPTVVAPVQEPVDPEHAEAEALGPELLRRRCSKCHTLFRVYTRVSSVATGDEVIERMRRKTGSGISPRDARILKLFLRGRAAN
jgi:hypothetical protein